MKRVLGVAVIAVAVTAMFIHCPRPLETPVASNSPDDIVPGASSDTGHTQFPLVPIRTCIGAQAVRGSGRVQVLVDASGSTAGFHGALPALVGWADLAISRLRGNMLNVESSSLCEFNARIGISNCRTRIALPPTFRSFADTNLHTAIAASVDNELTFIFTDGVAAAGTSNTGDCASAVDAACVARALRTAVHPDGSAREKTGRGVWVIPIVAPHDGVLYTEKSLTLAEFNSETTQGNVQVDLDADIAIRDPRLDRSGNLNFVYRGPRALLLIVIARFAEVGRAAVAALRETMHGQDIAFISDLKEYRSGRAAYPPIEVYPGAVQPVVWTGAEEPDDEEAVGSVDATLSNGTIFVQCHTGENEMTQVVKTSPEATASAALCGDIWSLPGFTYRLHATQPDSDVLLASFVKSYRTRQPTTTDALRLRLRCNPEQPERNCIKNPLKVQYTADVRYAATASAFEEQGRGGAVALVNGISTVRPHLEPHRIYGLSELLRVFYSEISNEQYRISLGKLAICNREAAAR